MGKLLVFGYFGAGNFGDEWTLASFLRRCRQLGLSEEECIVVSRNPSLTKSEHGVPTVSRRFSDIGRAMQECQWVVGCGGSLLQDVTSFRSLAFYCWLIWIAKSMGKKVALIGQGLGPLQRPLSRRLARIALGLCDWVAFRDPVSFQLAQQLGASTSHCIVAADLTFLWDDLPPLQPTYSLAVNLRPLGRAWNEPALWAILGEWAEDKQRFLLLPLQPLADELALRPLAERFPSDWWAYRHWRDGLEGIARSQFLLAMRLHALIAACLLQVPFVGLSYDPKVDSVLGQAASEHLVSLDEILSRLVETLQQVSERWDLEGRDRIAEFVQRQRHAAQRNWEFLSTVTW